MSLVYFSSCPVCGSAANAGEVEKHSASGQEGRYYECKRCGHFILGKLAQVLVEAEVRKSRVYRAVLSHAIRKMQRHDLKPFIDRLTVSRLSSASLPSPFEQADNAILLLGSSSEGPGDMHDTDDERHGGYIGCRDEGGLMFIMSSLVEKGLVTGTSSIGGGFMAARLTFDGWQRFYELQRGAADSRKAFMAMKFGDDEADRMFYEVLRPAVSLTGFHLERLDDNNKAGLIDDRLRVEIRTSRFLIADLTHGNPGAYWEAGFAEGLGKPVFYTCKKAVFNDQSKRPHFDTNHHYTVVWDEANPQEAAENLKAAIRATLPAEAKLQD